MLPVLGFLTVSCDPQFRGYNFHPVVENNQRIPCVPKQLSISEKPLAKETTLLPRENIRSLFLGFYGKIIRVG